MKDKWTDDEIRKAILIGKSTSEKEACELLGIPYMTFRRRKRKLMEKEKKRPLSKKTQQLAQQVQEQAMEKAKNYIYDRIRELADGLYGTAEAAVREAKELIETRKTKGDKGDSAWLKSLTSAFHAAIQDAQLLSGKPTARPEVTDNRAYKVTEKIIQENPELLEVIFQDQNESPTDELIH